MTAKSSFDRGWRSSQFPSPTAAAFARTRAFPMPPRRSGRCAGGRLSPFRRGPASAPPNVFGPNSLQGVVWDDIDPSAVGVSEDCLYLNVWTPAAPGDGARLPAMVWIHGGGFVAGSGAEPRYDGARLAARGIIVVTLNHRLNALGFLAHPELTAESDHRASGNYGLLDLVAALEWVKRNIAAFGGDPGKVTIAGEFSRLIRGERAHGLAARQGTVRPRHRRERGDVPFADARAGAAQEGRGRRNRVHAQG